MVNAMVQLGFSPKFLFQANGANSPVEFPSKVGAKNTEGIFSCGDWFPNSKAPGNQAFIKAYNAKYGGTPANIDSGSAEAYAVGEVVDQAVTHLHSLSNAKIISYLHSGVTLQSVQGPVKFNELGENLVSTAFIFQWQNGKFVQVLPAGAAGSVKIEYPKPAWAS